MESIQAWVAGTRHKAMVGALLLAVAFREVTAGLARPTWDRFLEVLALDKVAPEKAPKFG